MLASIPLIVGSVEHLNPPERRLSRGFLASILAFTFLCAISWLWARRKYVRTARATLAQVPNEAKALRRWQVGYITSFVLSEAVVLYGTNLRFYGLTFSQVVYFYIAGTLLMIFSGPRALRNLSGDK